MNSTRRIELPDGTCLTIDGANAEGIAAMISNELKHGPKITGFPDTEPRKRTPDYSGQGVTGNREEPLPLPTMNFANPAFGAGLDDEPFNQFAPPASGDREEPLEVPAMRF